MDPQPRIRIFCEASMNRPIVAVLLGLVCTVPVMGQADESATTLRVNSRVASMGTIRQGGSGGRKDRRLSHQAKLMFWSRSGTERIRLPVAAK